MKKSTLFVLFLLAFLFAGNAQPTGKRIKYSSAEIREDLQYLYTTLQHCHYNLFVHTKQHAYNRAYDALYMGVSDSLTLLQANRLFQPFVAMCGLAHCTIAYPFVPAYLDYKEQGGIVFPFDVSVENKRIFIAADYSNGRGLQAGDEILRINGYAAADRLDGIYRYLSGESNYFKNTLIDIYSLSRLYWLVYGRQDTFKLTVRKRGGVILHRNIAAITVSRFEELIEKKTPIFNPGREFRFIDGVAYLHPGQFLNASGDGNTSEQGTFEQSEFMHFLDSSFTGIRRSGTSNLIIDLRGNPGGDNSFSDAMLAYFAREPFSFCSRFSVRTSAMTKSFWKEVTDSSLTDLRTQILEHPDGTVFETRIPPHLPVVDSLRFRGRVYVLIDRYTYSNAVTTAATVQDYKWGVVAGETTADVPTTYAAIHEFKLPHTGMVVSYPKAFMVRPSGDTSLRGVRPDLPLNVKGDAMIQDVLEVIKKQPTVKRMNHLL